MSLLLLSAIITLAYAAQTAAGFGATVLAVTIGSFFMPIEELVPLLVPLSLAQTLWIGWRHRRQVDTGYLLGRILPLMVPACSSASTRCPTSAGPPSSSPSPR